MPLRVRFQYPTGANLGYSIERLSDSAFFDFANASFAIAPVTMTTPLPEDRGVFVGRYRTTLLPTPVATFTDGDYRITVHDLANSSAVVAQLAATMHFGDDVSQSITAPTNPTVPNSGFETPVVGAGKFEYGPVGGTWTFGNTGSAVNSGAGVAGNSSGFTSANLAAPAGAQVAFIQGKGSISQTVPNWAAGNYAILFQAAQRAYGTPPGQDLTMLVDGTEVGKCMPTSEKYGGYYKTGPFTVAQGNHTISFVGMSTAGGDNTAFIDDIQVVSV